MSEAIEGKKLAAVAVADDEGFPGGRLEMLLIQKRWIWFLPLLAGIAPALMAWHWAVVIPVADHWAVAATPWLAWKNGAPLFAVLHSQMNDSRLDAARAIHFLLADATRLNTTAESITCVVLALGTAAYLVWILRKTRSGNILLAFTASAFGTLLWLSPDQSMNWTYGVQICYMLVTLSTLAVIGIFQAGIPLWCRTICAAACAFIASYSFLNGLLAWPLGLACLLYEAWKEGRKAVLPAIVAWLAIAAVTMWTYFHDYGPSPNAGPSTITSFLERPLEFGNFFFTVVGAPISKAWAGWDQDARQTYATTSAPLFGVATLLLLAIVLFIGIRNSWKGRESSVFPLVLIACWGLANAVAVTIARTGIITSTPLQDRYLAFTLWIHIALLALLTTFETRNWVWMSRGWFAIVFAGYVLGVSNGLAQGARNHDRNRLTEAAASLRHVAKSPIFLDAVGPGMGPELIKQLDVLESRGCLHVPTVRTQLVSESRLSPRGHIVGGFKSYGMEDAIPFINAWAVNLETRNAVDALVISMQLPGERELWLGMAQRRLKNPRMAEKYSAHVIEDRLGFGWSHDQDAEPSFLSYAPNPFKLDPLPKGKITFRTYAFEIATGTFTPLEGECDLQIP